MFLVYSGMILDTEKTLIGRPVVEAVQAQNQRSRSLPPEIRQLSEVIIAFPGV